VTKASRQAPKVSNPAVERLLAGTGSLFEVLDGIRIVPIPHRDFRSRPRAALIGDCFSSIGDMALQPVRLLINSKVGGSGGERAIDPNQLAVSDRDSQFVSDSRFLEFMRVPFAAWILPGLADAEMGAVHRTDVHLVVRSSRAPTPNDLRRESNGGV